MFDINYLRTLIQELPNKLCICYLSIYIHIRNLIKPNNHYKEPRNQANHCSLCPVFCDFPLQATTNGQQRDAS